MDFIPVTSSNLDSVAYDMDKQELYVKFKNNSVYKYLKVPSTEYDNLLGAESAGKYLNQHIKPLYQVEKIA